LFYSLIESAELAGFDPRGHLQEAALAALQGKGVTPPKPSVA